MSLSDENSYIKVRKNEKVRIILGECEFMFNDHRNRIFIHKIEEDEDDN